MQGEIKEQDNLITSYSSTVMSFSLLFAESFWRREQINLNQVSNAKEYKKLFFF